MKYCPFTETLQTLSTLKKTFPFFNLYFTKNGPLSYCSSVTRRQCKNISRQWCCIAITNITQNNEIGVISNRLINSIFHKIIKFSNGFSYKPIKLHATPNLVHKKKSKKRRKKGLTNWDKKKKHFKADQKHFQHHLHFMLNIYCCVAVVQYSNYLYEVQ